MPKLSTMDSLVGTCQENSFRVFKLSGPSGLIIHFVKLFDISLHFVKLARQYFKNCVTTQYLIKVTSFNKIFGRCIKMCFPFP